MNFDMSHFVSRAKQWLGAQILFGLMHILAMLPLQWVRILGIGLAWVLYRLVRSRRHVAMVNLTLCFPEKTTAQIQALARQHFVYFVQAWMDRSWLWHGTHSVVKKRLKIEGATAELALDPDTPTILFVPHFVGLDAAATACTQQINRQMVTIYTQQSNRFVDAWVKRSRMRFGRLRLFGRSEGIKPILHALRNQEMLSILPDMNFGPHESIFVPFFGVDACTIPSLSRFARLGKAKVVPVLTRMTTTGYTVEILPAWENFPLKNAENEWDTTADTAFMNQCLEQYILTMPAQYFWVHKRFKDRPNGQPSVY